MPLANHVCSISCQHVKVGGLDIGVSKSNISKSPVVHKDKDNVGLGSGRGSRALQYQGEGQGQQDNTMQTSLELVAVAMRTSLQQSGR